LKRQVIKVVVAPLAGDEGRMSLKPLKLWLDQSGPALLHVHVSPMQLVMPPFMAVEPAVAMAL
jgi:hypothetical protein